MNYVIVSNLKQIKSVNNILKIYYSFLLDENNHEFENIELVFKKFNLGTKRKTIMLSNIKWIWCDFSGKINFFKFYVFLNRYIFYLFKIKWLSHKNN